MIAAHSARAVSPCGLSLVSLSFPYIYIYLYFTFLFASTIILGVDFRYSKMLKQNTIRFLSKQYLCYMLGGLI